MKKISTLFTLFGLASFASITQAHNGPRILLSLTNGQLVTSFDSYQGAHHITPNVRVFRGNFGQDEIPLPSFTQFPGLSGVALGEGALTPGTSISFSILDAARFWDGAGDVAFAPSPETISISSGVNIATTAAGPVAGFTLVAAVPSADGWHLHPGFTLNPDGLGQTRSGVYLLQLSLANNGKITEPFWMVFGQNTDTATLDRAADFIAAQVPEPASLGFFSAGLFLLAGRRRARE
jgi:hypothetical protein